MDSGHLAHDTPLFLLLSCFFFLNARVKKKKKANQCLKLKFYSRILTMLPFIFVSSLIPRESSVLRAQSPFIAIGRTRMQRQRLGDKSGEHRLREAAREMRGS